MPTPSSGRLPRNFFDNAIPFKIDGVYCKLIPLTQGQFAIVDAADYECLADNHWFAQWSAGTKSFYARRWEPRIKGKQLLVEMGRKVLGLMRGNARQAEHRSHSTLDNRRNNLRIATNGQNQMNRGKQKSNRSGYKGVGAKGKGFIARITVNGVTHFLGSRPTAYEAHLLYVATLEKYHGEFANAG